MNVFQGLPSNSVPLCKQQHRVTHGINKHTVNNTIEKQENVYTVCANGVR